MFMLPKNDFITQNFVVTKSQFEPCIVILMVVLPLERSFEILHHSVVYKSSLVCLEIGHVFCVIDHVNYATYSVCIKCLVTDLKLHVLHQKKQHVHW